MQSPASISHVSGVRLSHWLREEWAPVLFVVALVTALHHVGVLAPVSRLSLLVLSWAQAVGSSVADANAGIWLVTIDEATFETRYGERRPFNRCVLRQDLEAILKAGPKVLVVDLDLSPPPPLPLSADPTSDQCQTQLDELLDGVTDKTAVVLIKPFGVQTVDLQKQRTTWMQERKRVYFADPEIEIGMTLNTALEFRCNPNGLAETAMAAQDLTPCVRLKQDQSLPLDYGQFKASVFEPPYVSLAGKLHGLEGKTVFFGSRSGRADRVFTPMGSSHGVVVHAARFATIQKQESLPNHRDLLNLLIDLLMAASFSWVIAQFMHRYIAAARERFPETPARLTVMLAGFTLAYLFLMAVMMACALALALLGGLITEPLMIAFGLAVDGFVLAGWAHLGQSAADDEPEVPWWPERLADIWRASSWAAGVEVVRWVVFWSVVFFGLGRDGFFGMVLLVMSIQILVRVRQWKSSQRQS